MITRTSISTRFPYTTLFRSGFSDRNAFADSGVNALANFVLHCGQVGVGFLFSLECLDMALAVLVEVINDPGFFSLALDRKSTRLNSSHLGISYAVFCLKKKI